MMRTVWILLLLLLAAAAAGQSNESSDGGISPDEEQRLVNVEILRNKLWYWEHKPQLLKQYGPGKWLVIARQQVFVSADDQLDASVDFSTKLDQEDYLSRDWDATVMYCIGDEDHDLADDVI